MPPRHRQRRAGLLAALLVVLTGCSEGSSTSPHTAGCTPSALATTTTGRLTLSTGKVTRDPWVTGGSATTSGDPRAGTGYDAAVGYALADALGFSRAQVTWVGSTFDDTLEPGPKAWDVNVNQVTITEARRQAVDLSAPYYVVHQAVVTVQGRALARAARRADLTGQALGYVTASAGERAARQLHLDPAPVRFPDLDTLRGAVSDGRVQGLITDYPTALRLAADETQLVDGTVAGVLPSPPAGSEEFGLVLAKDSTLTRCVDRALAALARNGALGRLARTWLVQHPGLRELS